MGLHQPAAIGQCGMELEQFEGAEGNPLAKGCRGGIDGVGTEDLRGWQLACRGAWQVRLGHLFNGQIIESLPVAVLGRRSMVLTMPTLLDTFSSCGMVITP